MFSPATICYRSDESSKLDSLVRLLANQSPPLAALATALCHSTSSSFLVEELPVWIGGMGCSASQEGKEEEDTKGDKDQELIQVQV